MFREVQVNDGFFEILMAEQELDGAQISAGLEEMRSEAVPKQMGINAFLDPRSLGGLMTCVPNRFHIDRPITAMVAVA